MTDDMKHELIYTSRATHEMNENELTELLVQSREKNGRLKITGLLVYGNQEFIQLLEGNKDDVFNLYSTIVKDARHTDVKLIWDAEIEKRNFTDWSMAFLNINSVDLTELKTYSRFLQDGVSSLHCTGNKSIGKQLLVGMRDNFL